MTFKKNKEPQGWKKEARKQAPGLVIFLLAIVCFVFVVLPQIPYFLLDVITKGDFETDFHSLRVISGVAGLVLIAIGTFVITE